MTTPIDLVDQLKNVSTTEWLEPLCQKAADEIVRLRDEEDHLHKMTIKWSKLHMESVLEVQALRQQNAELMGSLQKIASIDYRGPMPDGVGIAKRAIAKATGGE